MSKTLIIITRSYGEYDTFWGFVDDDDKKRITHLEIDQSCKVIFIEKDGRDFPAYCPIIKQELTENLPDEVGIIIHLVNGDEKAASIENCLSDEIKNRLKFCMWYSGTMSEFWDRTDAENTLPYNAFRAAVKNSINQTAAFERVWSFFLYDQVLEAKLELLQNILNEKTPDQEILALLQKKVADFDEHFKDFRNPSSVDVFSPEYQTAFEKFRDALGIE